MKDHINKITSILALLLLTLGFCSGSVFAADNANLSGLAHVEGVGWVEAVSDSPNHIVLGTVGQGRRIEAFTLNTATPGLGIQYQAHVQDIGWQNMVSTGQISGTEGQAKRVEAFILALNGEAAPNYNIWYRTHVQDYGWLDWTNDWAIAGTVNHAFRCEALEIVILPADQPAPGSTLTPSIQAVTRAEATHMIMVNLYRRAHGLNYLTGHPALHAVATLRAQEIAVKFSHYRPDGSYFDTAVKSLFPNYRLNAGGILENITFGRPDLAQPVQSFNVIEIYPHNAQLILQDGARYLAWDGYVSGTMGYSVEIFSGLDRIDFAD